MQAQDRSRTQTAASQAHPANTGATYRFLVRSAEEAAGVIHERLGGHTRVVSVRSVKAPGIAGWLGGTRLEVIAQVVAAESTSVAPATVASSAAASEKSQPTEPEPAPIGFEGRPGAVSLASRVYRTELPAPMSPAAAETAAEILAVRAGAASARRNGEPDSAETPAPAAEVSPAKMSEPTRESSRPRRNPPPQRIEALLRRSGLSESLIDRLRPVGEAAATSDRPLHLGLSAVADEIRVMAESAKNLPLPRRAAFIGMSGVGRTTALCKWLSSEVFMHGRRGAVASVEFDRAHANEDLAVFAELLGLEFARQVLPAGGEGETFQYFDLPPLSLTRPDENAKLRAYLDQQDIPGRVLVLSALHDPALLRQACSIGQDLGCTHLVFTHLDELPLWGKLWDFLIEAPFTPLLLSLGPSQSGEGETEVVGAVLRRTFPWN